MMIKIKEVNVLITGMGPYPDGSGGRIDVNTSHLITTLLPKTLEPNTARNPSSTRINIITLPEPVKTEYIYVRDFCRQLHAMHAEDVDLFIHLGEARGWSWLTIERVAYKQGMSSTWWNYEGDEYYNAQDDAGQTIRDTGPSPWDGVPLGLRSAFDVDEVADGARTILKNVYQFGKPGAVIRSLEDGTSTEPVALREPLDQTVPIEVRPHNEGGPYMCGFINYESLANRYVRNLTPDVLFCHMPGEADMKNLKLTGDGILAITVSAVTEVLRRRTQ